jgi:hypothetical protein
LADYSEIINGQIVGKYTVLAGYRMNIAGPKCGIKYFELAFPKKIMRQAYLKT